MDHPPLLRFALLALASLSVAVAAPNNEGGALQSDNTCQVISRHGEQMDLSQIPTSYLMLRDARKWSEFSLFVVNPCKPTDDFQGTGNISKCHPPGNVNQYNFNSQCVHSFWSATEPPMWTMLEDEAVNTFYGPNAQVTVRVACGVFEDALSGDSFSSTGGGSDTSPITLSLHLKSSLLCPLCHVTNPYFSHGRHPINVSLRAIPTTTLFVEQRVIVKNASNAIQVATATPGTADFGNESSQGDNNSHVRLQQPEHWITLNPCLHTRALPPNATRTEMSVGNINVFSAGRFKSELDISFHAETMPPKFEWLSDGTVVGHYNFASRREPFYGTGPSPVALLVLRCIESNEASSDVAGTVPPYNEELAKTALQLSMTHYEIWRDPETQQETYFFNATTYAVCPSYYGRHKNAGPKELPTWLMPVLLGVGGVAILVALVVIIVCRTKAKRNNRRGKLSQEQTALLTKDGHRENIRSSSSTAVGHGPQSGAPQKDMIIDGNEYTVFFDEIGKGGFGTVLYGCRKSDMKDVAIKHVQLHDETDLAYAVQEVESLQCLPRHENIIEVLDAMVWKASGGSVISGNSLESVKRNRQAASGLSSTLSEPRLSTQRPDVSERGQGKHPFGESTHSLILVTPYYEEGDLRKYLRRHLKQGDTFPERKAVSFARQLVSVVDFLHCQRVVHRDIKPENILLHNRAKTVILTDFGLAKCVESKSQTLTTKAGTPAFLAPECFQGRYHRSADVWALGCLLYAMATCRVEVSTTRQFFMDVLKPDFEAQIRRDLAHYDRRYANVVLAMVRFQPEDRIRLPDAFDILNELMDDLGGRRIPDMQSRRCLGLSKDEDVPSEDDAEDDPKARGGGGGGAKKKQSKKKPMRPIIHSPRECIISEDCGAGCDDDEFDVDAVVPVVGSLPPRMRVEGQPSDRIISLPRSGQSSSRRKGKSRSRPTPSGDDDGHHHLEGDELNNEQMFTTSVAVRDEENCVNSSTPTKPAIDSMPDDA